MLNTLEKLQLSNRIESSLIKRLLLNYQELDSDLEEKVKQFKDKITLRFPEEFKTHITGMDSSATHWGIDKPVQLSQVLKFIECDRSRTSNLLKLHGKNPQQLDKILSIVKLNTQKLALDYQHIEQMERQEKKVRRLTDTRTKTDQFEKAFNSILESFSGHEYTLIEYLDLVEQIEQNRITKPLAHLTASIGFLYNPLPEIHEPEATLFVREQSHILFEAIQQYYLPRAIKAPANLSQYIVSALDALSKDTLADIAYGNSQTINLPVLYKGSAELAGDIASISQVLLNSPNNLNEVQLSRLSNAILHSHLFHPLSKLLFSYSTNLQTEIPDLERRLEVLKSAQIIHSDSYNERAYTQEINPFSAIKSEQTHAIEQENTANLLLTSLPGKKIDPETARYRLIKNHDLRNSTQIISMNIQLLNRFANDPEYTVELDERTERYLDKLNHKIQQLVANGDIEQRISSRALKKTNKPIDSKLLYILDHCPPENLTGDLKYLMEHCEDIFNKHAKDIKEIAEGLYHHLTRDTGETIHTLTKEVESELIKSGSQEGKYRFEHRTNLPFPQIHYTSLFNKNAGTIPINTSFNLADITELVAESSMNAGYFGAENVYVSTNVVNVDNKQFYSLVIADDGEPFTQESLEKLNTPGYHSTRNGGQGRFLELFRQILSEYGGKRIVTTQEENGLKLFVYTIPLKVNVG